MPSETPKLQSAPKKVSGRETYAADYFASDTDRQVWLGSPHIDSLVSVVIALGSELWASKQRQIIAERLAERGIPATSAAIETYKPSKEEEAEWETERQKMASRIYSTLARIPDPQKVAGK